MTIGPTKNRVQRLILLREHSKLVTEFPSVRSLIDDREHREQLRERREAIREDSALHSLRTTLVDAAIKLADQLFTAQHEFHRSIVRSAERALSKPDEEK